LMRLTPCASPGRLATTWIVAGKARLIKPSTATAEEFFSSSK
jgi:hypothetical protein